MIDFWSFTIWYVVIGVRVVTSWRLHINGSTQTLLPLSAQWRTWRTEASAWMLVSYHSVSCCKWVSLFKVSSEQNRKTRSAKLQTQPAREAKLTQASSNQSLLLGIYMWNFYKEASGQGRVSLTLMTWSVEEDALPDRVIILVFR
jgi:hypothetical protein